MLGFEHKIVLLGRLQEPHDGLAAALWREAVPQHMRKVGLPAAKIIIDINARNTALRGSSFQRRDPLGHRQSVVQQCFPAWKGEIIDDINQEEGHGGLIGRIPMEIMRWCWHSSSSLPPPGCCGEGVAPAAV